MKEERLAESGAALGFTLAFASTFLNSFEPRRVFRPVVLDAGQTERFGTGAY